MKEKAVDNNLGIKYINEKQYDRAFELFMKGARAGDEYSMNNLACCYTRGFGCEMSDDEAFKWFRRAADLGHTGAMESTGSMYHKGSGTARNDVAAYRYLMMARNAGSKSAGKKLDEWFPDGAPVADGGDAPGTEDGLRWKRYNIFISSTFKDMDFERDVIKFKVIPELNRRFREQRVELQAIDLRLGVNTAGMSEEESERKVLSVCASSIDSARPFFIGLIGSRYGWIPPVERWQEFLRQMNDEDREVLSRTAGCSVTEMEIVYGALSQKSLDTSHTLFFLRDPASYEGLPAEEIPVFVDADAALREKLESLRSRVEETMRLKGGNDDFCTSYTLRYDASKGAFESDDFERLVYDQLAMQIEAECSAADETLRWWQKEAADTEAELLRYSQVSEKMESDGKWHWGEILSGPAGCGKSTLLAQQYADSLGEEGRINLCAIMGRSSDSQTMRQVLVRWVMQLSAVLGRQLPSCADLLDAAKTGFSGLADKFNGLVSVAKERGIEVWCFIDNLEALLLSSPRDLEMTWLNDGFKFVLAADSSVVGKIRRNNAWVEDYPVKDYAEGAGSLVDFMERQYFLELPASADAALMKTPLQLRSAFRLLECASQGDFTEIRKAAGSQIDSINGYLLRQWNAIPSDIGKLLGYMSRELLRVMGLPECWLKVLKYIHISASGLRESDIETLLGTDWNGLEFTRYMSFLGDFFTENMDMHLWYSRYRMLDFVPEEEVQGLYGELAGHCASLPEGDFLRESMGVYYTLKSGRADLVGHYLTDSISSPEIMQHRFRLPLLYLLAEGFLADGSLPAFCGHLDADRAVQLAYHLFNADHRRVMADDASMDALVSICSGVDIEELTVGSCFQLSVLTGYAHGSVPALELSLRAGLRCRDIAGIGWQCVGKSMILAADRLMSLYAVSGRKKDVERMEALVTELAAGLEPSAQEAVGVEDYAATVCEPLHGRMVSAFRQGDMKQAVELAESLLASVESMLGKYVSGEDASRMYVVYMKYANDAAGIFQQSGDYGKAFRTFFRALMEGRALLYCSLDDEIPLEFLLVIYMGLGANLRRLRPKGIFRRKGGPDAKSIDSLDALIGESMTYVYRRLVRVNPENRILQLAAKSGARFRDFNSLATMQDDSGKNPVTANDSEIERIGNEIIDSIC